MALLCGNKKTLAVSTMNVQSPLPPDHEQEDLTQHGLEQLETLETGSHTRGLMEHITLVMKRGNGGYGFSINGQNPAKVSKIESGTPADKAGLQIDDFIIHLNGKNVSRMPAEQVGMIVRQSEQQIMMDIHRYQSFTGQVNTADVGVNTPSKTYTQRLSDSSSDSGQGSISPSEGQGQNPEHVKVCDERTVQNPPWLVWRQAPMNPWQLYREMKERQAYVSTDCDSYSEYSDTESCYSCSTLSLAESDLTETSSVHRLPVAHLNPHSRKPVPPVPPRKSKPRPSERTNSQLNSFNGQIQKDFCSTPKSNFVARDKENFQCAKQNSADVKTPGASAALTKSCQTAAPSSEYHFSDTQSETGSDKTETSTKSTAELQQQRQQIFHSIYTSELRYCQLLQAGLRMYYRPLSDCVLSTEQHTVLFQNVYQLCSVSEVLLSRLHACRTHSPTSRVPHFCDIPGLFMDRLEELCQAYEMYCVGVRDAMQLLGELKGYDGFETFVNKLCTDPDQPPMANWLQKPVEYIKDLTVLLMKAFKCTPPSNPEHSSLQHIVKALKRTTAIISEEYIRRSQSTLSSLCLSNIDDQDVPTQRPASSKLSHNSSHSSASSSASSSSSSSSRSTDVEVMDIQRRLRFVKGVKNCNLVKTSRHVIYKGELMLTDNEQTQKVFAILMSDILLLTKPSPSDGTLVLMQDPILLHDIKECLQGEWHPSEIVLRVECHHCEPLGVAPKYYTFRAPTLELKCVWKNIILHRLGRNKSSPNTTLSCTTDVV